MIRDIPHSVRQLVSARSLRQAFLVVGLCILLALSMGPVAPVSAQEDNQTIPQCDQGPPIPGQEEGGGAGGVEVALTNDRSSSMDPDDMQSLKDGSIGLVDSLENPDEAAAVSFAGGPTVDQELTTDHQAVIDAINDLPDDTGGGSGTDIDGGISTAHDELIAGENATEGVQKVMVLFSDAGSITAPEGFDAAQAAKDDGIRIFAIGYPPGDEEDYETMASSPDDAYYAPTQEEMGEVYDEIGQEVEEIEQASQLTIDTRSLFQPGETHEYTVTNTTVRSDGTTESEDVTAEASVNPSNTSLLTADEAAAELTATDDANASAGVVINAEHGNETGCVNAIVAQASMENLELLPTTWRIGTFLGDWTVFLFIVSIGAGIVGTRIATSFMGLSMMEMVLLVGWFGGYISTGLIYISVFAVLFIGLNLAANIDYQVQR